MPRLRLIHWNAGDATRYLSKLSKAGYIIDYTPEFSPQVLRDCRASPPDVFVIDLSRLPSHGREIATALRQFTATRHIPILFCEGEPEKVARVRATLPDAAFSTFAKLNSSLRSAIRAAPTKPVVPTVMMDRYAGRTVAQKLGIRDGDKICLIDSPREMPAALGPLPENTTIDEKSGEVTLLFITDPHQLRRRISELRSIAAQTKLWICWKKGKAAAAETGVSENLVRDTGLALGLVDYKICSVSQIWSGLLFARKK